MVEHKTIPVIERKSLPQLICYICDKQSKNTEFCQSCLSNFCSNCISDYFVRKNNKPQCPNCYTFKVQVIQPVQKKDHFICQYEPQGCPKNYNSKEKCENHIKKCKFLLMKCLIKKCQKKVSRKDLEQHFLNDCGYTAKGSGFMTLGTQYHLSDDKANAKECFYLAGNQGNLQGFFLSAMLAMEDAGNNTAAQILFKSANLDHKDSIHQLAQFVYEKSVNDKIVDEIIILIKRKAKSGNIYAQNELYKFEKLNLI